MPIEGPELARNGDNGGSSNTPDSSMRSIFLALVILIIPRVSVAQTQLPRAVPVLESRKAME